MFRIVFALSLIFTLPLQAGNITKDPYGSPMWEYLVEQTFGKDVTVKFDDRIQVHAPVDAESNFQVPVSVDASALGSVEEIVLLTDLNPFPIAAHFYPMKAKPYFATRVKLNEGSVIHAVARTPDGVWHMNGAFVSAEGGGCAAPPQQMAAANWADHLMETRARIWQRGDTQRLRLRVNHPMDTGLSGDVPAFFVEDIVVRNEAGEVLTRFKPHEAISENPVLTLDFPARADGKLTIYGRDNNANDFNVTVGAHPNGT